MFLTTTYRERERERKVRASIVDDDERPKHFRDDGFSFIVFERVFFAFARQSPELGIFIFSVVFLSPGFVRTFAIVLVADSVHPVGLFCMENCLRIVREVGRRNSLFIASC